MFEDLISGAALEGIKSRSIPTELPDSWMTPMSKGGGGSFLKSNTFRDILGGVGDVLMLNSGMKPLYTDWREGQMVGDAMKNFDNDPMGAISEISKYDRTLGAQLLQKYQAQVAAKETARITAEDKARNDALALEKENFDKWSKYMPGVFATMASASDQRAWDLIRPKAIAFAKRFGQELDPSLIEETWSPQLQQHINNFAISPTAQAQIAATDTRSAASRAISEKNYDLRASEADEPKVVDRYTNKEGKRVLVYEGGTEVVGKGDVRPTSNRRGVVTGGSTGTSSGVPKVGEIRKGHRFNGGDPADRKNWTKI